MTTPHDKLGQDRLLVIDDEPMMCRLVRRVAKRLGFDVQEALNIQSAEDQLRSFQPTVLVLDLSIPGRDGASFLRDLAGLQCTTPILLISGLDANTLKSAHLLGVQHGLNVIGTMTKPLSLQALGKVLSSVTVAEKEKAQACRQSTRFDDQFQTGFQPVFRLEPTQYSIAGIRAVLPTLNTHTDLTATIDIDGDECRMHLVRNITDNLLLETVSQLSLWQDQGLSLFAVVALPPSLFNDPGIPERLTSLMEEFNVSPAMLVLDISCADLETLPAEVSAILARLRSSGFQLLFEFDALNTSTMNQARAASVTSLGIDPSILADCTNNQQARNLLQAMNAPAHRAGLTVWARDISDYEQLATAMAANCDFAMGEFIGPCVAANQLMQCVLGDINHQHMMHLAQA